jgi:hypothetical protein
MSIKVINEKREIVFETIDPSLAMDFVMMTKNSTFENPLKYKRDYNWMIKSPIKKGE